MVKFADGSNPGNIARSSSPLSNVRQNIACKVFSGVRYKTVSCENIEQKICLNTWIRSVKAKIEQHGIYQTSKRTVPVWKPFALASFQVTFCSGARHGPA